VLTVDEHEFSDSRSDCLTRGLLGRKPFRNYWDSAPHLIPIGPCLDADVSNPLTHILQGERNFLLILLAQVHGQEECCSLQEIENSPTQYSSDDIRGLLHACGSHSHHLV